MNWESWTSAAQTIEANIERRIIEKNRMKTPRLNLESVFPVFETNCKNIDFNFKAPLNA